MSKARFLIVDDDRSMRDLISAILESKGIRESRITLAVDGQDAWEIFSNDPDYQVLITDIRMPRMDGLQLIEKILANFAGIKIICMSGTDQPTDERVVFLKKPFQNEMLWNLVKSYA